MLSRALEKGLGLDPTQAEAYKRTYGLDGAQLEGKVRDTMQPVFKMFVAEMQKALQYFSGAHQGAKCLVFCSLAEAHHSPTLFQVSPRRCRWKLRCTLHL